MFRKKYKQIAPASKLTWNDLSDEQRSKLNGFFDHPGAEVYLRLLAAEQDSLTISATESICAGDTHKATVSAARAMQAFAFARHQGMAKKIRDDLA